MRIGIVTPAARNSRSGNRVSANRWSRILGRLGYRVTVVTEYAQQNFDCLVALHARRSYESIVNFKQGYPDRPLVLVLTGTDLYGDIQTDRKAQQSLELADRLVSLQPLAINELTAHLHPKLHPIIQSAQVTPGSVASPASRTFDVCVVGGLRQVKDPFRAALASRLLPSESKVRIVQVGGALEQGMEQRALEEQSHNPRYKWFGNRPHWQARRIMKRSRLLVQSSISEGGANVVSEAAVDGVPILASRMPGNIGLLGPDYPGYFEVFNTEELAELIMRAEGDLQFTTQLKLATAALLQYATPGAELNAWGRLIDELVTGTPL